MKKTIAIALIVICILALSTNIVFASETTSNVDEKSQSKVTEVTNKMEKKKAEYVEKYGSDAYWVAGYIIEDIVQPYSIPLCLAGIIVGLVFQYVMGTRRLDYKHRGFGMVIVFVTILVICQVLPFVYALVLFGWRN